MVRAYRATPHPTTGVSPFELVFGRKMRIGELDTGHHREEKTKRNIEEHVEMKKKKSKILHDKRRNTKPHNFKLGDVVLADPDGKGYVTDKFTIIKIKGSTITGITEDKRTLKRNSTHFKLWHPSYDSPVLGISQAEDKNLSTSTPRTDVPSTATPEKISPTTQTDPMTLQPSPPTGQKEKKESSPDTLPERRQTRSRGPVPNLPNVMKSPIERSPKERSRFKNIIDKFPTSRRSPSRNNCMTN